MSFVQFVRSIFKRAPPCIDDEPEGAARQAAQVLKSAVHRLDRAQQTGEEASRRVSETTANLQQSINEAREAEGRAKQAVQAASEAIRLTRR